MIVQGVVSEKGGQEGKWIAFLCALILLIGALLLPHNQTQHQSSTIAAHQVSIKSLTQQPLAMIADLRLAHEEIYQLYQESHDWQSVKQLEQQWIPPFVQDKSWQYQGQHRWQKIADGVYQGVPAGEGARYILNSQQAEVDIWLDLKGQASLIDLPQQGATSLALSQLIESGWMQVVFQPELSATSHVH